MAAHRNGAGAQAQVIVTFDCQACADIRAGEVVAAGDSIRVAEEMIPHFENEGKTLQA
jgi:hypothetical protein